MTKRSASLLTPLVLEPVVENEDIGAELLPHSKPSRATIPANPDGTKSRSQQQLSLIASRRGSCLRPCRQDQHS